MVGRNIVDTVVSNARIVLPDRILTDYLLLIQDGCIVGVLPAPGNCSGDSYDSAETTICDFAGDFVVPGLIDLHVHGCGGADTMDAESAALDRMAAALLQQGTTAFLATTMSAANDRIQAALSVGAQFRQRDYKAELLGFHMEGPCISPSFRGAQKPAAIPAPPFPGAGGVKIVTLAPEIPEADAYIDWANSVGALLAAGHSGASYEEMKMAISRGVLLVTHAFNAMPGIHHRLPGLLTAALLDPCVTIELIADGVHIHPAVLELALRLKGPDQVVLVSDGTRAVGMPDGEFELGGQKTYLKAGRMTLTDGTIAGSAAPLLAGVRLLTEIVGRPLYEAVRMATLNPARLLKVDGRMGSLEAGKEATFLRLSPELALIETWVRGKKQIRYDRGGIIHD